MINRNDQTLQLSDGRQLGYAEYGDPAGKPLFYFHGWPSCRVEVCGFQGDQIAARLGLRLIAPDRPGTGISDFQPGRKFVDWPGDVTALADHLGLERFGVLSYSAGSPYALACAALLPERVSHAGVVSGLGQRLNVPGATKDMPTVLLWRIARFSPRLMALLFNLMRGRLAKADKAQLPANAKQAMMAEADFAYLQKHPEINAANLEGGLEALRQGGYGPAYDAALYWKPWGFRLEGISIPVFVWHGEADLNAPLAAHGKYLAQAIPGVQAKFFPGEGHISLIHKLAKEFLKTMNR